MINIKLERHPLRSPIIGVASDIIMKGDALYCSSNERCTIMNNNLAKIKIKILENGNIYIDKFEKFMTMKEIELKYGTFVAERYFNSTLHFFIEDNEKIVICGRETNRHTILKLGDVLSQGSFGKAIGEIRKASKYFKKACDAAHKLESSEVII